MSLTASAQYLPHQDNPDRYRVETDGSAAQDPVFNHLRSDLDRVQSGTMPYTSSRDHVIRAEERVDQCQRDIQDGTYDSRTFDRTIAAVQNVVDASNLTYQDQQYLRHDLRELSRLEARLEG
jgi:hypothetical protein